MTLADDQKPGFLDAASQHTAVIQAAERQCTASVLRALLSGASWPEIGSAIGMVPDSARKRYGPLREGATWSSVAREYGAPARVMSASERADAAAANREATATLAGLNADRRRAAVRQAERENKRNATAAKNNAAIPDAPVPVPSDAEGGWDHEEGGCDGWVTTDRVCDLAGHELAVDSYVSSFSGDVELPVDASVVALECGCLLTVHRP